VFGAHDFTKALTDSVNTTFAKVGTLIGQAALIDQMRHYGFLPDAAARAAARHGLPERPLPGAQAAVADRRDEPARRGLAAVGQESVLATPLQMALVAAGVADAGQVMKPYLVQRITSSRGNVLQRAAPSLWTTATTPATAQTLNVMMQQVVNAGNGHGRRPVGHPGGRQDRHGAARRQQRRLVHRFRAGQQTPKWPWRSLSRNTLFTGGDVAAPLAAQVIKAALAQPSLP